MDEAESRRAVAQSDRNGIYLAFTSDPGFDLVTKSLEARPQGIRLLNVKTIGPEDAPQTIATVYVPREKSGHFLAKVTKYAAEDNPPKSDGTTTPKNAPLISSIGDIRAAIVETFWQDAPNRLPTEEFDWVEVWLSTEDLTKIEAFESTCAAEEIELGEGRLSFPERTVRLVRANRTKLARLIELSDDIAELRAARAVATFFVEQENREQTGWVEELLARTQFTGEELAVLVLDHGVNNGHRLLEPLLEDSDKHTVRPEWGTHDHDGHGTWMAGAAAYGDLTDRLQETTPLVVPYILESAKILPPPPEMNPKRLWGHTTARGIALAEVEAPTRKRIICMAVTSADEPTRGRPSSWSGAIDEVVSGQIDGDRRLFIVSAGNVETSAGWRAYPASNEVAEVQDPGQAWNALTVGAFTEKTRIEDPTLAGYQAIAEGGSLSPYSSTSLSWIGRKWPIKPEVLMEGGNVAKGPNNSVLNCDDLQLLSTSHDPQVAQFVPFNATSAASALAARMAAHIQASYPTAWPETVRALIVHSANWTEAMRRNFLNGTLKSHYEQLARTCGYGAPNLERALSCAANSLSIIAEAEIQPYTKKDSRGVCKDVHLYRLPWPEDVLRGLGALEVKMRVTLSYFVEPSPGEVGWKDRYRYPSHTLRFELNGPGESEEEFLKRINTQAREDGESPRTTGAADHWTLGDARNLGSIHSDIWKGTAAELARSNLIAVHSAIGWWRERLHLAKVENQTRYSLVVSFELPGQEIDIYTPVSIQLGVPTPVEIPIIR